jgi:hypothetical protein
MIIIGVDFHPEFQQMASVDTDTGEFQEKLTSASGGCGKVLPCTGRSEGLGRACGHARSIHGALCYFDSSSQRFRSGTVRTWMA